MKAVIDPNLRNRVTADEVVRAVNAKAGTNFTAEDFDAWRRGKYAHSFNQAVKSYVSDHERRVAAALGAIAAQLKLS